METIPEKLLLQIHSQDYLSFLHDLESQKVENYNFPKVWNYSKFLNKKSQKIDILAGNFVFDTFTPFTQNIKNIALESANLAYSATKSVLENQKYSYALCRPHGHHATREYTGGYCYLANSSLAAQFLLENGKKPCILDIDFHHGNGAQEIWYDSNKVLTISIHRDPTEKFPYYSGFSEENGCGEGLNWNFNFCLPKATKEKLYLETLDLALEKIKEKNCDFLIVSAGFDTYKFDPICDFELEIQSYTKIASKIKELNLPTVILQEGGYNLQDLGKCVASFLQVFKKSICLIFIFVHHQHLLIKKNIILKTV